MVDNLKSWFADNQTLVYFLFAQFIAIGALVLTTTAYVVRLESRVSALETRGPPHLVVIDNRLTVLETLSRANKESIDRVVNTLIKDLNKPNP